MTAYVSLRVGVSRCMLLIERIPPMYLRFVMVGTDWKTLDVLNQPEDTPKEEEHVYATVKKEVSTLHIDGTRGGKRFAEWRRVVVYELVPEQPPQEVLRDTARWQEWATKQYEAANDKQTAN